jgi:ferredoxin
MSKLISLTIDGRAVEVPAGSTVLAAAQMLGMAIPTLCFLAGVKENRPSCMACVVRINGDVRLVPSCATKVTPGMTVASETPDVKAARKAAMELLFSDHLGDCVSVCQRVCPARMQIPAVIRLVAAGRMPEAIALVKENVVFPGVLGRICRAPCQQGCRRSKYDGAVAIQLIEREVAQQDSAAEARFVPLCKAPTGRRIAIVGAGATGLAAAFFLLKSGHACVVFDDHAEPGGQMRHGFSEADLPREVLDGEIAIIHRMGLQFRPGTRLGREVSLGELRRDFDVVVLAVGSMRKTDPAALGVEATERTIRIDAANFQTSVPGVFAGGTAVRTGYDPSRSVGDGRILAECVDRHLEGKLPQLVRQPFTSTIPKLTVAEYQELSKGSNATLSVRELITEAEQAAGRCCHCDCRSANHCKLQHFGELYGADPRAFAGEHRRRFEFIRQPGGVLFEPGKCITCGICVELATQAQAALGLTYVGRGFDVRIAVPLDRPLAEGLQPVAEQCVKHCPTGALTFEEDGRNTVKHQNMMSALLDGCPDVEISKDDENNENKSV